METIEAFVRQIRAEKEKSGAVILAHTYQPPEIIELADITGDSYALSVAATKQRAGRVIVCGVRFMAETVKILSPDKEVILPAPEAACPMAEQVKPEEIRAYRAAHPQAAAVAYINTTASLKAECDVCVTSSSALKIVRALPEKELVFLPDRNLGGWVKAQVKEKDIAVWDGCCPVHDTLTQREVRAAKAAHPGAKLAVHPECREEVVRLADYVGATSGIIEYALRETGDVIIGTERGVVDTLRVTHPARGFYQLRPDKLVCPDMKATTLPRLLDALRGTGGERIELDEALRLRAKRSLDNMLKYGG